MNPALVFSVSMGDDIRTETAGQQTSGGGHGTVKLLFREVPIRKLSENSSYTGEG